MLLSRCGSAPDTVCGVSEERRGTSRVRRRMRRRGGGGAGMRMNNVQNCPNRFCIEREREKPRLIFPVAGFPAENIGHFRPLQKAVKITAITCKRDFSLVFLLLFFLEKKKSSALEGRRREMKERTKSAEAAAIKA